MTNFITDEKLFCQSSTPTMLNPHESFEFGEEYFLPMNVFTDYFFTDKVSVFKHLHRVLPVKCVVFL